MRGDFGISYYDDSPVSRTLAERVPTTLALGLVAVCFAVAAGVLDAKSYPANSIYPRDLAFDEHVDLSPVYDRPAVWFPRAELEHIGGGIRVSPARDDKVTR